MLGDVPFDMTSLTIGTEQRVAKRVVVSVSEFLLVLKKILCES